MAEAYLISKALHLIAVVIWMGGMITLPMLFSHHAGALAVKNTKVAEELAQIEVRLLRRWMNPAMVLVLLLGLHLVMITGVGAPGAGGWFHVKFLLAFLLFGLHGYYAKCRKDLAAGSTKHTPCCFKKMGMLSVVLFIAIVFLVVLKPF